DHASNSADVARPSVRNSETAVAYLSGGGCAGAVATGFLGSISGWRNGTKSTTHRFSARHHRWLEKPLVCAQERVWKPVVGGLSAAELHPQEVPVLGDSAN